MKAFRVEEMPHGFLIYGLHEGDYLALCPRHKISGLRTHKRKKVRVDQISFKRNLTKPSALVTRKEQDLTHPCFWKALREGLCLHSHPIPK